MLIKNPLPRDLKLKYQAIKLETADMLPEYSDAQTLAPETESLAEKVHPGQGEKVYNRLCHALGFKQPLLDSYLGGYMGELFNHPRAMKTGKNLRNFFQLYLVKHGLGPFGWKYYEDALLCAYYNIKTKKAEADLIIDFD